MQMIKKNKPQCKKKNIWGAGRRPKWGLGLQQKSSIFLGLYMYFMPYKKSSSEGFSSTKIFKWLFGNTVPYKVKI
jgi:hypothetical protein